MAHSAEFVFIVKATVLTPVTDCTEDIQDDSVVVLHTSDVR